MSKQLSFGADAKGSGIFCPCPQQEGVQQPVRQQEVPKENAVTDLCVGFRISLVEMLKGNLFLLPDLECSACPMPDMLDLCNSRVGWEIRGWASRG